MSTRDSWSSVEPQGPVVRQSGAPDYSNLVDGLRSYEGDPTLDLVWKRLEGSRRQQRDAPLRRAFRSGALVAAGVLLGMWIQSQKSERVVVSAEQGTMEQWVPAAHDVTPPRRPVPLQDHAADAGRASKSTPEARLGVVERRVRRRPSVAEDLPATDADEISRSELPELGPQPILPPVRPRWLLLADRGDFAGAFQELDGSDGVARVLESGSAEELMTLVDISRVIGRQGRAIQALRVVIQRHQSDPNAPLAAMMLGNLLSRAGDDKGAAEAFALNRRLAPGGDFAEDALVSEFDMAIFAKKLAEALQLADQYDEEFPDGRHADQLRLDIARLAEALVATSRDDAAEESGTGESVEAGATDVSEDFDKDALSSEISEPLPPLVEDEQGTASDSAD